MSSFLLSLSPAKRGNQGLETKHLIPLTPTLFCHSYLDLLILGLAPSTGSYTPAFPHLPVSLQPLGTSVLSLIQKVHLVATSKQSPPGPHLPHPQPHGEAAWDTLECLLPLTGLSLRWPCLSLALDTYVLAFSALVPASPA